MRRSSVTLEYPSQVLIAVDTRMRESRQVAEGARWPVAAAASAVGLRPVHVGAVCFPHAWAGTYGQGATTSLNLAPRHALALAELLQVLSCGEESATATFESLAQSSLEPTRRSVLMQIAADERRHQLLLSTISAGLPQPQIEPGFVAMMRRFFMRLADRDMSVHFLRIAALDSAACQFLALLRARTSPLAADDRLVSVLRRIHMDEARHVRLARECAGPLAGTRKGPEIFAEVRGELAELIRMKADSVEALSIDPDRLDTRLRSVPACSWGHLCRR
jgi:rubrerythrin